MKISNRKKKLRVDWLEKQAKHKLVEKSQKINCLPPFWDLTDDRNPVFCTGGVYYVG